jgi:hypothetical protein
MKKITFGLLLIGLLIAKACCAQFKDLQLHYELGSFKRGEQTIKRDFFKTKLQILNKDSLGLTYITAEVDYNAQSKGMSFGQFTVLRSLKLPFLKYVQPMAGHAAALGRSNYFFAGVLIPAKIGSVKLLPMFLYSYNKDAKRPDARAMVCVSTRILKFISIFGFASCWTYDNIVKGEGHGKKSGWQLSPQIWFHVNKSFAVGTKIDYSRNLYSADGTNDFLPTTGVRWVF